jgi:aquaporin Z
VAHLVPLLDPAINLPNSKPVVAETFFLSLSQRIGITPQDSMNGTEHNLVVEAPNLAVMQMQMPTQIAVSQSPKLGASASLRLHWPEYLMEAGLLGAFMVSACLFGVLYGFPQSPVRQAISSDFLRGLLGGLSMGLTAIAIFYSPWGKQSGAHINPSVTLTFLRLGKIKSWDALFYIASQFVGAALGVFLVAQFLRQALTHPAVRYVVTTPGRRGPGVAFAAELIIAFGMMSAVLYFSNHQRLSRYTAAFASLLVATYITLEAPLSGMSMNPARSFGSAFSAGIWDHFWIYLTAPLLGMLTASELYLWRRGREAVKCCKLHHDNEKRCIFCGANGGFAP